MSTAAIVFENVSKQFPNTNKMALDGVNVSINEGEFITILGSSGCGKTTLLKMINKLYDADSGEITLFGEEIKKVDAVQLRRRIGYVIQQVGLFPHMTIKENISTLPKILKWEQSKIDATVTDLLTLVGLEPEEFQTRYPSQLSGGQQQRVGLARALASDPKIMLLDEPFGAIDAITRTMLQDEILRIHQEMERTFIFVTHDINEALKLGTRVIIMNEGKIVQFDTPQNIVRNPTDGFVQALIKSAREQMEFWEELV